MRYGIIYLIGSLYAEAFIYINFFHLKRKEEAKEIKLALQVVKLWNGGEIDVAIEPSKDIGVKLKNIKSFADDSQLYYEKAIKVFGEAYKINRRLGIDTAFKEHFDSLFLCYQDLEAIMTVVYKIRQAFMKSMEKRNRPFEFKKAFNI